MKNEKPMCYYDIKVSFLFLNNSRYKRADVAVTKGATQSRM